MPVQGPAQQRLHSPPEAPLTSWTDWRERLQQADTYLLATILPYAKPHDGKPHAVPVLAVWHDEALYFTAKPATTKATNLSTNPHCTMSIGDDTFDLIVHGQAAAIADRARLFERLADAFTGKYPWWHPTVRGGRFYPDGIDKAPSNIYKLTPATIYGFGKERGFSASRWRLD